MYEEDGAHDRASVWHLLMNLKSSYLLKNTVVMGQQKM